MQRGNNSVDSEIAALTRIAGHINVVTLHQVLENSGEKHMVMDLCCGGDLYDYLVGRPQRPESTTAFLFWQVTQALVHCHSRGVIHRDVKPENILVATSARDAQGRRQPLLKLADFEAAVCLQPGVKASGLAGTLQYMAPEVALHQPHGAEADMWSLGVSIFCALAGCFPFPDPELTVSNVSPSQFLPPRFNHCTWSLISPEARNLVQSLLQVNPSKRPTASQVLQHPWIAKHAPPPEAKLNNMFMNRVHMARLALSLKDARREAARSQAASCPLERRWPQNSSKLVSPTDGLASTATEPLRALTYAQGCQDSVALTPIGEPQRCPQTLSSRHTPANSAESSEGSLESSVHDTKRCRSGGSPTAIWPQYVGSKPSPFLDTRDSPQTTHVHPPSQASNASFLAVMATTSIPCTVQQHSVAHKANSPPPPYVVPNSQSNIFVTTQCPDDEGKRLASPPPLKFTVQARAVDEKSNDLQMQSGDEDNAGANDFCMLASPSNPCASIDQVFTEGDRAPSAIAFEAIPIQLVDSEEVRGAPSPPPPALLHPLLSPPSCSVAQVSWPSIDINHNAFDPSPPLKEATSQCMREGLMASLSFSPSEFYPPVCLNVPQSCPTSLACLLTSLPPPPCAITPRMDKWASSTASPTNLPRMYHNSESTFQAPPFPSSLFSTLSASLLLALPSPHLELGVSAKPATSVTTDDFIRDTFLGIQTQTNPQTNAVLSKSQSKSKEMLPMKPSYVKCTADMDIKLPLSWSTQLQGAQSHLHTPASSCSTSPRGVLASYSSLDSANTSFTSECPSPPYAC
eukprot:TRINITY_DN6627_c0_g1_i1.p1 TRINITY_DN6627_c0_g1~~TRINITY_DN6627_c0_g1_i1.p1  ORF type:complete len:801 (-),score=67.47 TRINITY_DN6627_c0_g1_i1:575-2977(-)